jgi:hypothetical protein
VIFSFCRRKGEEKKGRETIFLALSLSLVLPLNEEFIRFICCCAPSRFFCSLLLIERVFVWQASVKYETDQSTLDFVSEQIMHPFNEKIYNPTHRLHLL